MLEAICTRCEETFVPGGLDPDDIIHGEREDGTPCGGIGDVTGEYLLEEEPPQITPQREYYLEQAAIHGSQVPNCSDPDCEFHHPEVIET